MPSRDRHVVVVGGGIAGLAAAHALAGSPGVRVTLFEAGERCGGKLRTTPFAGLPVEEGPEIFLARVPEVVGLTGALGLELVHPATTAAALWTRGRLRPLPPGTVFGVPGDWRRFVTSGVLSWGGMLRAGGDLVLPRTRVDGDVAVGAYVRARMGHEVVERLVDPLLGGVYAGRADGLSLAATLPALAGRPERSLLRAARAASPVPSGTPVFATVSSGLGTLASALTAAIARAGVVVRTGAAVRGLERDPDGWTLTVGAPSAPEAVTADAVVLALPAAPAARLLGPVAPAAAADAGAVPYASVALVAMAWPRAAFPPGLGGSGYLVPAVEGRLTKAVTFLSRKWAHLDTGDLALVRASVGRYGDEADVRRDDADLVRTVVAELREATGIAGEPAESRVSRWDAALPQYVPGHAERVARIRAALPSGLALAGAAYDGVGIPACIRSGQVAAAGLLRGWGHD